MTAVQFVPKVDALPGDLLLEAGKLTPLEHMPVILSLEDGGARVRDGDQERLIASAMVKVVLRIVGNRRSGRPEDRRSR